ncbi:hypothetical protein [Marinitoga sp. 38H-ov]|uniref:hypothetical protein n=1 Tax=Marinitoga sp. 38H-ov TaxID=1755814 RepID=UPI0019CFC85C|nr:hypothetical protein [Marinitoga sp. 38H-ov]
MAIEFFDFNVFENTELIVENMAKMVSKSSLISLFEKPKFKDALSSMTNEEKKQLVEGIKQIIHGDQELGFNLALEILTQYKLAKWTLLTVFPYYYFPRKEVFIKPNTTKLIINYYELEDIKYSPKPSYDFYVKYRNYILEMKKHVDKTLDIDNAAFTGFLMMATEL